MNVLKSKLCKNIIDNKLSVPFLIRMTVIKEAITNNPDKIIITERSVYTDREVFAKMLHDDKKIDDISYQIYFAMFNEFLDHSTDLDKMIFVNTDHNICNQRVNKRNRDGEKISLEYLEKCGTYHKNWLLGLNDVLVLDGNIEFENDQNIINNWIKQILDFSYYTNKMDNDKKKYCIIS